MGAISSGNYLVIPGRGKQPQRHSAFSHWPCCALSQHFHVNPLLICALPFKRWRGCSFSCVQGREIGTKRPVSASSLLQPPARCTRSHPGQSWLMAAGLNHGGLWQRGHGDIDLDSPLTFSRHRDASSTSTCNSEHKRIAKKIFIIHSTLGSQW